MPLSDLSGGQVFIQSQDLRGSHARSSLENMSIRLIKNATHFQIYQAFNVSFSHAKPLGRKNDKESGSELDDVPAGLGTLRMVPALPGELRTYIFIILVPLDGLLDPVRETKKPEMVGLPGTLPVGGAHCVPSSPL